MFGVSLKNMNKAERLAFGESLMTHAMTFTAVSEKVSSPACHDRFISGQVGPHTPVDCLSSRATVTMFDSC